MMNDCWRPRPAATRRRSRRSTGAIRLQIRPLALDDDDLVRVEELATAGEGQLSAVVDGLPPAERHAIWARVVNERDYREIADELRCSESVVRQRVSRGLARLRTRLAHEEEE